MKEIKVVQNEEGVAEIRICGLDRQSQDDLEGQCSECRRAIFYQPHPPFLIKMICLECGMPLLEQEGADMRCSSEAASIAIRHGMKFKIK